MNSKLLTLFVVVVLVAVSSYAATLDVPFEYEVDSTSEYFKKKYLKFQINLIFFLMIFATS